MKTKFILFPLLAVALVGCTRENFVSAPAKAVDSFGSTVAEADLRSPIQFSISSDTKTVTEVTAATLQTTGFKVCCAVGESTMSELGDFSEYFNTTAAYNSESAKFSTVSPYYFPESGAMVFYAANADLNINFMPSSRPDAVFFTVSQPWEKDVVTATATFDSESDMRGTISLAFSHRLAQMSIAAKGAVSGVSYDVTSVSINTIDAGQWCFSDATDPVDFLENRWRLGEELVNHVHFTGTAACGASSYSAVGSRFAYFPGTWTVTVTYRVKSGSVVLGTYSKTFDATLTQGKRTQYNLTLPYDDNDEIVYSVTVADWVDESYNISL